MKQITKALLAGAILLAIMNVQVAKAEERLLVVPAHYWSDGSYHPTIVKRFSDNPWSAYDAHTSCMIEARMLHANLLASPAYSMCTTPSAINLRDWK